MLDSGVGGLSVMREIHRLLPDSSIHYIADSSWCPYGNKPSDTILRRVTRIADYLLEQGCEILVIACNSATIHAVGSLRATYPIPIVGMEPAVKPAAELTQTGTVGVLATEASIAGDKFHQLVNRHAQGIRVITQPCPRFVELVESGTLDGPEAFQAVEDATSPLLDEGADVLVLGCTHYPFLRPVIESQLPPHCHVIDTGPAVAKRTADLIAETPSTPEKAPSIQVETTGSLETLESLFPRLLPGISASLSQSNL